LKDENPKAKITSGKDLFDVSVLNVSFILLVSSLI
jgi:hypothetical protein